MSEITFEAWPKTPRLFRESMVITEKIDGTNSAVGVKSFPPGSLCTEGWPDACLIERPEADYLVYAQSRKRIITPSADNYGFASWVWVNAGELARVLGPGLHYGEWWGRGLYRGYGVDGNYFSLFNTRRWKHLAIPQARESIKPPEGLRVVPILSTHTLDIQHIQDTMAALKVTGSHAAPGFMDPEGICVFLPLVGRPFKVTFDGDNHKGLAGV